MAVLQVLVIDDEAAIRQVLASQIAEAGHEVEQADCAARALERLARGDIDVAVCDLRLPDFDGIELIRRARAEKCDTGFLMITAFSSVDTAIEAMKAGAFDYLVKPLRGEDVLRRIEQIGNLMELQAENRRLRTLVDGAAPEECRLRSSAMNDIERLIAKMARTDGTVLITGESGTGKGYIAKQIHERSGRADSTFISVNCGAVPENLLESEFFGHLKGSFTGADRAKKGLFVEANGGTLFLDEIGELPVSLQVKLLHVLEESAVRPVGSETSRRVDVRIVAATNRDINQMVEDGTFREDLFYRLNILHIHMPALRDRREDIRPLVDLFISKQTVRMGLQETVTMDPAAEEILENYGWPGNVRQLQNVVARTLILADGNRITLSDLPPEITRIETQGGDDDAAIAEGTLRDQVRRFEVARIRQTIDEVGGDRQVAAKRLGIGLSTLYRKLDESSDNN